MRWKSEKEKEMELKKAKRDALKAAFELGYMDIFKGIREEIDKAKTVTEVTRILATCRRAS
ncbi:MAG TPA: hypothetical protein HA355_03500 [Methanosphaera sp.]|nr:hypothetical protein [Methanosphaera sp.]